MKYLAGLLLLGAALSAAADEMVLIGEDLTSKFYIAPASTIRGDTDERIEFVTFRVHQQPRALPAGARISSFMAAAYVRERWEWSTTCKPESLETMAATYWNVHGEIVGRLTSRSRLPAAKGSPLALAEEIACSQLTAAFTSEVPRRNH